MRMNLKDRHEAAHFWANKVQAEGKAGNVFFHDNVIYSYGHHFPIAKHIAPGVVAFTTDSYSPSTGQHMSIVRNAIPHGVEIVYIPDPAHTVSHNKEKVEAQIERLIEQASKARRESTRSAPLADAMGKANNFNRFAEVMKDRSRIDVKKLNLGSVEELKLYVATKEKRELLAAKKLAAKRLKESLVARAEWRLHERRANHMYQGGPVMLRMSKDLNSVETSMSASIPVADALRLWPLIERVMGGLKDYEVGMQLGDYRLNQIKTNGDIVVGCHNIPYAEIEAIHKIIFAPDFAERRHQVNFALAA